ncbi:ornithine cyclodeaminase [Streptomyces sp. HNM0575]|uniref:ornithine cyclodeaminase n=1 Tax=Streptomyces sp. HNM0575 TaxID=2716338 RepID=UPI00145DA77F|nr:ornithine cyclodeaminase [Streptomyces sp. HNM0575]NLU75580.1 ornithine cyclodeaminase [Streptomyces sp. HNM0575]
MPEPELHLFTRSDLADLEISPQEVISAVRQAYLAYARGASRCPTKLMMPLPDADRDAVSYSMLGYDGNVEQVGFKTSYRQGNDNPEKYYTAISLYDDTTGMPFALMDCHRVGASRTPATTALIAEECAKSDARSALMIGTGAQALNTLPYLLTVLPNLERLMLFGTHEVGIPATFERLRHYFPDRELELVEDVPKAVAEADIAIAASGRAAHPKVQTGWMKPGGLLISVSSKGVDSAALSQADYALATNEGQLGITGSRFAAEDGSARIDAEFPDVVAGRALARRDESDRVFAFSSGMVITDIPVAHALAHKAIADGRGKQVALWS